MSRGAAMVMTISDNFCFRVLEFWVKKITYHKFPSSNTIAEILTSNSLGTQLFFLGCNQDNIGGSNFITKKKICLVLPEKEISNHRN